MADVKMNPVQSSNVKAIGYDPKAKELHVQFANKDKYVYAGVSPKAHQDLVQARSIGSHMSREIAPKFKFTKA